MNFPRLLVATEFPPNAPGGGPAIVRQMLRGWPGDRLFWWSCFPDNDMRFGQRVTGHRVAAFPPKGYPNRRFTHVKSWILENIWTPLAEHHFRATLKKHQPTVVWVIPHCWSIPPIAKILPTMNLGFHTSMHDYVNNRAGIQRFGQRRCERLAILADLLYEKATTRDAISRSMSADLRRRTGMTGNIVHAGLSESDFAYLGRKLEPRSPTIRIAYAGTISVEPVFELFVEALSAVRTQLPKPISLEIYGSHSYTERRWFDRSWMVNGGNLTEADLSEALRQFSWGFVPMSLSAQDPPHLFSLPTKFVTYLAAGLPVITIGHEQSGLIQLTQKYSVGISVTLPDKEALCHKLIEVFSLKDPWNTFRSEILRCARDEFDFARMRDALHENFLVCAQQTGL